MKRLLPAYPLFVKDPYFSIWSPNEYLNEESLMFWNGEEKGVYGVIELDGKPFSFMGLIPSIEKIEQTSLNITMYTTDYTFENSLAKLSVSFVSPLLLNNMDLLSCPVCYLKYSITLKSAKSAKIIVCVNGNISYNDIECNIDKTIRGGIFNFPKYDVAWLGLMKQAPLSHAADNDQANWGYFYLTGEKTFYTNEPFNFELPSISAKEYIVSENENLNGDILIGFDDEISILYFGDYLKGYYFRNGKNIFDALEDTYNSIPEIDKMLEKDDLKLKEKSVKYGPNYYNLLCGSLRQSVGAHKLVIDKDDNILFLSKECCSNGCIGTVDVSYPSIPLYLMYNTEYVKGMARPIFKFAKMPVWGYDFAPHDVGTYPICSGQVYGLYNNETHAKRNRFGTHPDIYKFPKGYDCLKFEWQMPVEECANMIIMLYSSFVIDKDAKFLKDNFDLLEKWVNYLVNYGLKPENQLCTDDFGGHLKNNLNLAIKATVAIKCYAKILEALNKDSSFFNNKAREFASEIEKFNANFKHLPLTWDSDDQTFSVKYNFAFDKLLNLNLFKQELYENEINCYLEKMNKYGTPLDSRKNYTKSDWLIWASTLTDDASKSAKFVDCDNEFLLSSPHRYPFGDWFDTTTGERVLFGADRYPKAISFINRTVQGGIFILLLKDLLK